MTKGNKKKTESIKHVFKWKILWSKELIFKSLCVLVKWAKSKAGWQTQNVARQRTPTMALDWSCFTYEEKWTLTHCCASLNRLKEERGKHGAGRAGHVAGYFTVEQNKREWKELISHPTPQVERTKWSLWGYTVIWLIFRIYVDRVTLV